MKKIFAILFTVAMLASMATVASAASTTTLSTTVPAASYTLNIPADQKIDFGAASTNIGKLTITNASGFADGKNLNISVTYTDFECEGVATTIPFTLTAPNHNHFASGTTLTFLGKSNGTLEEGFVTSTSSYRENEIIVEVESVDWGKALAGEYTATITFTAEVVAE